MKKANDATQAKLPDPPKQPVVLKEAIGESSAPPPRRTAMRKFVERIAAIYGIATISAHAANAETGRNPIRSSVAAALSSAGTSIANVFRYPALGAKPRNAQTRHSDWLSILDFISEDEHAAIKDGSSTYDCLAAFQAALAIRQPRVQTAAFGAAGPTIYVPAGVYRIGGTIEIKRRVHILGEGSAYGNSSDASRLIFPANTHGFIIHAYNTIGSGDENPPTTQGTGSILEGLHIDGTRAHSTSGHGVWMRAAGTLRECRISNFSGNGFHIHAIAKSTGITAGNANLWRADRLRILRCGGHGFYVQGADANAGLATLVNCSYNEGWGIYDHSFLGNTYDACHTETNKLGSYKTSALGGGHVFVGCYAESGQGFGNEIAGCSLILGGMMDAHAPLVVITGDGRGARAIAQVSSGRVINIQISSMGSGYSNATISIHSSSGSGATAAALISAGAITKITVTAGGSGYAATDEGMQLLPNNSGPSRLTPIVVHSRYSSSRLLTTSLGNVANTAIQWNALGDAEAGLSWAWDETNGCWMTEHARTHPGMRIATNLSINLKCGRSGALEGGSVIFGNDNFYLGASLPNARKMSNGTAAPTSGAHAIGDILWNRVPTPGGNAGWICTTEGTPGTWKTFGAIDR